MVRQREEEYQEVFGVKERMFEEMLKVLEADYVQKHKKGGNPPELSVPDKLIIMLQYYCEYRAMRHIAWECKIKCVSKENNANHTLLF